MALATTLRASLNYALSRCNLRLETLTADKLETSRLIDLDTQGYFARPAFTIPRSFQSMTTAPVLDAVQQYTTRFDDFSSAARNPVGFTFANEYFPSPDAEVYYTFIRTCRPNTLIEVGSGNSTKIARQAIIDGKLATRLVCIDPAPRLDVQAVADEFYRCRVEEAAASERLRNLTAGDILFIDSSHQVKTGNDVVFLYLRVFPELPPGVLVHLHDIFLPYDYPRQWVVERRWDWNEQYLVQALLTQSDRFETLWAAHYLQRTMPEFGQYFPQSNGQLASSLWLRTTDNLDGAAAHASR